MTLTEDLAVDTRPDQGGATARMEALLGTLAHLAASYSEPDRVVGTIVRSTARLLGTDAAHVMLVDEDQRLLRVQTAYGITSQRFYDATCHVDELLPGAAIRTRSVRCVRDMSEHEQAIHYRTEGVRTVMCAPMFVEDELLGVLMAAHRTVYEPSADDIALMTALAGAAAVAIANARLHAEHERSIEQLGELNHLLAERSEALERTLGFQRTVTSRVLQGRGLADVVETAAAAARSTLVVVDRDLTPLHPVTTPLDALGMDLEVVAVALDEVVVGVDDDAGLVDIIGAGRPVAAVAVSLGAEHPAFVLVVPDGDSLDAADLGIVDAAVTAIGLELLRDRATAEAEARVTGGVFQALLSDEQVDEATVMRRAAYLGYELGCDNGVIAVRPSPGADAAALGRTEAMVRRAVRRTPRPTAVFERDNVVYAVVAAGSAEDLAQQCRLVELEAASTGNGLAVHIAHAGPHHGVRRAAGRRPRGSLRPPRADHRPADGFGDRLRRPRHLGAPRPGRRSGAARRLRRTACSAGCSTTTASAARTWCRPCGSSLVAASTTAPPPMRCSPTRTRSATGWLASPS